MPEIFHFPERLARAPSVSTVCGELLAHAEPLGFGIYAIGALPPPNTMFPTDFFYTNWPEAWHEAYYARDFGRRDPTLRALACMARPFSIADIRAGLCGFMPTPEELEVMDFAALLGVPHGLVVPVYRAQGYTGIACLVGQGPDPAPEIRARLQFLAEHAHDRLRSLSITHAAHAGAAMLSPREIEVLTHARHGLGDAAIAEAAGIRIRTVRFHFENARRKLGARSRSEAVAVAVARHLLAL